MSEAAYSSPFLSKNKATYKKIISGGDTPSHKNPFCGLRARPVNREIILIIFRAR